MDLRKCVFAQGIVTVVQAKTGQETLAPFAQRSIGTAQLLLAKPAAMPAPLLGRFNA